jgi:E3 SUMO-protein ligase PIAS1
MGSRQSAGVPRQTGGANSYISMPVLDELMLHNRMNQTTQAARGQTSSAAQVGLPQANIQIHARRSQTMPQAATPVPVPRAPLLLHSPSEPTGPSTPQAGACDSLPELPVDENWRPTGQMRGSLTGNAYNHAFECHLGSAAQQQSQALPPRASDGKRPR